eukprot:211555_1
MDFSPHSDEEETKYTDPTLNVTTKDKNDLEDTTLADIHNAMKSKSSSSDSRCKTFIIQSLSLSTRVTSLLDIITDCVLLYKSSSNQVLELTMALFLSMICPYVLSYSSGVKLFIYRKTFDNLVGFKNIFLVLYLLPSGIFYFIILDLIDILLSLWIWISFNILCRSLQYIKELQNIIALQLGMDRMNFEGLKRQKSISQICFESLPQLLLQLLLMSQIIPGKDLAQITTIDLQISMATAIFNLVAQITKLYIESVAVDEYFVEYCLHAMMARVSWVPFRLKIVQLTRSMTYNDTKYDYNTSKRNTKPSCCNRLCSVYYRDPLDDERTINYKIQYRIPLISWISSFCSKSEFLVKVDYDFSSVTIGHLIATINQISSSNINADIQIKFHKSLKLLGVREIINVMEVCKRKSILLPDIASCVDWAHAFSISSKINENDPRLATFCHDYNSRPLLTSMYKAECDTDHYVILNAFLENDCPVNLKDSNNETIIYHMVRNNDHNAIQILFAMQKIKNCETYNLNIYNKLRYSPLFEALQQDLKQIQSSIAIGIDHKDAGDDHVRNDTDEKAHRQFLKELWSNMSGVEAMELWQQSLFACASLYSFELFVVLDIIEFKLNYDILCSVQVVADDDDSIQSKLQQTRRTAIEFVREHIAASAVALFEQEILRLQSAKELQETKEDLKTVASSGLITAAVNYNAQHSPLIDALLDNGADINFSCFSDKLESCLGYVLKYHFASISHEHILQNLLDRDARLFHNEIHILPQLFIDAASKSTDNKRGRYFSLLESVVRNSELSLQSIVDLEGNTPIHTAIIVHNMKKHASDERRKHIGVLSALCRRYPLWINARNYGGDYSLFLAFKYKDIDSSFCLLKHIATQRAASAINMYGQCGVHGNPIHIAIQCLQSTTHHDASILQSIYSVRDQWRILSQLCAQYPYWMNARNGDGIYPLILSVNLRSIASTFCLLSFLSRTDAASMYQMMKQKAFVQNMILWIANSVESSAIIKLFLNVFQYDMILRWPQTPDFNAPSAPISLMKHINQQDEAHKTAMMKVLKKECDIENHAGSDILSQGMDLSHLTQSYLSLPAVPIADVLSVEEVKEQKESPDGQDNHSDSDTRDSSTAVKDSGVDDHEEEAFAPEEDDESKPVNWIELLYSTLVESFSTADFYTDVVIMVELYDAKQQWWATWMLFLVIAPYLVSYSALGSIVQHRIQSYFVSLNERGESSGCCEWFMFNVLILILMTPLCLVYFIVIDVVFMVYVLLSTSLFIVSCTKLDVRDVIDDVLFKNVFGMNKTQIIGYRRLRTLSQLFFETFLQVVLQLRILYDVRWSGKQNVEYSITEETLLWSIFFAALHLILEAIIVHLDSRALKMGFTKYAIVCLGARVGWIPYSHLIEKRITQPSTSDDIVVYDYDRIEANVLCKRYSLTYTFSNEYLETFSQILGRLSPRSLPSIFYSSNLCNPMLESLFKSVFVNTKIKFGPISARDIDIIALAEFYQASMNKVAIDVSDVDGNRLIRNTHGVRKRHKKIIIDSLIQYGLIECSQWLHELDFNTKTQIKQLVLENSLKQRSDAKYARFDILRRCQHHFATDCETTTKIYSYLKTYLMTAKYDPSYYYVAIFLLYYTSGTVFNHSCNLGCHEQDIIVSALQQYLPKKVTVNGIHSIPIRLLECFDVFNVYFEELLINICQNAIIAGGSSTRTIPRYELKLKKEHHFLVPYLKDIPSSLYRILLRGVTKKHGIVDPGTIPKLDALTQTLQMSNRYGVYLRKSLRFRNVSPTSPDTIETKLHVDKTHPCDVTSIFDPELNNKKWQISSIDIEMYVEQFDLKQEDICRAIVYFNNRIELNNMIFFDAQIGKGVDKITISLETSAHALGCYNRQLLLHESVPCDLNIYLELASKLKSDTSAVRVEVIKVTYDRFQLSIAKNDDSENDIARTADDQPQTLDFDYKNFRREWDNLLERQKYKEAERLCHEGLAKSPSDQSRGKLYSHLGYLYENYLDDKTFDDIIEHYVLSLQVDESNSDSHYNLANFLLGQGMQHLLRALELNPNHDKANKRYANLTPIKNHSILDMGGRKYQVLKVVEDGVRAVLLRKRNDGGYAHTDEESEYVEVGPPEKVYPSSTNKVGQNQEKGAIDLRHEIDAILQQGIYGHEIDAMLQQGIYGPTLPDDSAHEHAFV